MTLLVALGAPGAAPAQTLHLCNGAGRALVVTGPQTPPGCRAVTAAELGLATAAPDLDTIVRALARQGARIERLERLLLQQRSPVSAPPARPRIDPFDTRGRTRDLGRDIDRRLDALGR